jgi:peptidoglycan lytic transglycosylase D
MIDAHAGIFPPTTWPGPKAFSRGAALALILVTGFGPGLSLSLAQSEIPTTELTQVALPPEASEVIESTDETAIDPSDEPDGNLVPVDTELSAEQEPLSTLSEANSLVPRAEDLLTVAPPKNSPAARFADLFTPPAEIAEAAESLQNTTEPNDLYNVPIVIDSSVQAHIRFFNVSIRDRFEQWLVRLSRYRPLVDNIFSEFHLPSDLVFLSLVESGFNPHAYSRAKATGPWQFMKGTAKVYGLRVDSYVDERRDPIKSTIAAARYLRDLYDLFGTWPLAMAAYNAGEGKVMRALRKAQAKSFSEISKTRLIRRETKEYVPRFMAATIIAKNPDRYGFSQEPTETHEFEEVLVTRPLHFHAIANATGVPYEELRLLNPELRRDATPPGDDTYLLKVPIGTKTKVEELLDHVPTYKFPPLRGKAKYASKDSSRWYKVRVGDTLGKLAKRFRIPLRTLKARNNLSGSMIRVGDLLNIGR